MQLALVVLAVLSLPRGAGAEAPVALVLTPTRLYAIEVAVNGVPVWLDVDTGSGDTALDSSLKRPLRLKAGVRRDVFPMGGALRGRMTVATLKVPGHTADRFSCTLVPLNRIAAHAKGDQSRGILAADFLIQAGAIIDFGDRTIQFGSAPGHPKEASERMLAVPFDCPPNLGITVPVRINGRDTVALIDSGAVQTHVYADVAFPNKVGRLTGDNGLACTIVDQLAFSDAAAGRVLIEGILALLRDEERSGVKENPKAAAPRIIIGLDILCLCDARIDFRTRMLYLSTSTRSVQW